MVTNVAIVANAVRHWDDVKSGTPVVQCDSDLL
ncbi:Rnf-Nqr [Synechococcus phage S-SM1]|uniref:Rnf-Nqr n=1 Tax=Synechococcus phage S-SM1 TaxID=444859 RepID=E3SIF7_9CAUD|nr:Rnf-Nqr [Synechococcus phage S-SM1]ADO97200.1 Rnf-Nqr [Synechococcus phage S-SM1]